MLSGTSGSIAGLMIPCGPTRDDRAPSRSLPRATGRPAHCAPLPTRRRSKRNHEEVTKRGDDFRESFRSVDPTSCDERRPLLLLLSVLRKLWRQREGNVAGELGSSPPEGCRNRVRQRLGLETAQPHECPNIAEVLHTTVPDPERRHDLNFLGDDSFGRIDAHPWSFE